MHPAWAGAAPKKTDADTRAAVMNRRSLMVAPPDPLERTVVHGPVAQIVHGPLDPPQGVFDQHRDRRPRTVRVGTSFSCLRRSGRGQSADHEQGRDQHGDPSLQISPLSNTRELALLSETGKPSTGVRESPFGSVWEGRGGP